MYYFLKAMRYFRNFMIGILKERGLTIVVHKYVLRRHFIFKLNDSSETYHLFLFSFSILNYRI